MDDVRYKLRMFNLCLLLLIMVRIQALKSEFKPMKPGYIAEGSIVQEKTIASPLECARICAREPHCSFYQHGKAKKDNCVGLGNVTSQPHSLISSQGVPVYKKNFCADNKCNNGGTCNDTIYSFTCLCAPDHTGDLCETTVDECASIPCQNGGSCVDGVNSYICTCTSGYTGDMCETNIDECESSPCQNGGTCTDGVASYNCNCETGFTGGICETEVGECESTPCQNGGVCVDGVASYNCNCAIGYTGDMCETNIDECESSPCQNGGTCIDGVASYNCNCETGFTGDICETEVVIPQLGWVAPSGWSTGQAPVYYNGFEMNNDFTLHGASVVTGKVGSSAIGFDKTNSEWVDFGTNASASCFLFGNCTNGGTMSVWLKIPTPPNIGGILSSYEAGKTGMTVHRSGANCCLLFSYYMEHGASTGMRVELGLEWFHMVALVTSGTPVYKVYFNGTLEKTDDVTGNAYPLGPGRLVIGRHFVNQDNHYGTGEVDELSFWNRELSASEVMSLYNQHK